MTVRPAENLAAAPSVQPLADKKPTAVVVDDSITTRTFLKAVLAQAGVVVVAEGERGDQAVPLYEKFQPTFVTLDIIMPILDGMAAAAALLERHPDAQVIMCSSLSSRDKILACRDLGVKHFILKPMALDTVVKLIRSMLEGLGPAGRSEVSP